VSGPYQQQPTPSPQPSTGGQPYGAPRQPGTVYGQPQPQPYQQPGPPPYAQPQHGRSYGPPQPGTPYGPPQPYGQPYQSGPPRKARNGFAIASLIFGIIGGIPLALGFGVAGLVRAAKVRRGKVMSIVGMSLSVLWLVPIIFLVPHVAKASDPGCIAGKATVTTYGDTKLGADANDPAAMKNDLRTLVTQLNEAAGRSNNAAARTALKKLATDFNELLTDVNNLTPPSAALQSRIAADAKAVDDACGTIG
jgi:hypothetical protein